MYDPTVVPTETFKLILLYMQGLRVRANKTHDLQGMSKIDVIEKAREMDKTIIVTDKKDSKSSIDRIKKKRVSTIIEMLSLCVYFQTIDN